ncbi:DEKNAAC102419 [Brettanomyces naardenensis]|uniref:DEKNAAC102419 n=1 Tax=Brettanomyces naardenensis TaxID=13370 RepID=A0A448YKR3_BRENA|nr:DEKNAAC102419 [Brettanomyces naardenensis]
MLVRLARRAPATSLAKGCYFSTQTAPPITDPLDRYVQRVERAQVDCDDKVQKFDPSSFLLSKFLPPFLRPTYMAIRAFNIELSKVSMGGSSLGLSGSSSKVKPTHFADMKFAFWDEQLDKCGELNPSKLDLHGLHDPVSTLIADSVLKGINIDLSMLKQMVYSHKHYLHNEGVRGFSTIEDMCSFGEGTYSQMNYLIQSAALTPELYDYSSFGIHLLESPATEDIRNNLSDISAHIGQATAICSFIVGLKYFAQKNGQITIPVDTLVKHRLSQEDALRMARGEPVGKEIKEALKNCVFEVSTVANDNILSARNKLQSLKDEIHTKLAELKKTGDDDTNKAILENGYRKLRKGLPDCLYSPFMSAIPTVLYLERLQKYDFDILNPRLQFKEWRLSWRAYRDYHKRVF